MLNFAQPCLCPWALGCSCALFLIYFLSLQLDLFQFVHLKGIKYMGLLSMNLTVPNRSKNSSGEGNTWVQTSPSKLACLQSLNTESTSEGTKAGRVCMCDICSKNMTVVFIQLLASYQYAPNDSAFLKPQGTSKLTRIFILF